MTDTEHKAMTARCHSYLHKILNHPDFELEFIMNVDQVKAVYALIERAEQYERNLTGIEVRVRGFTKREAVLDMINAMDNSDLCEMFNKYHMYKLDECRKEMKLQGVIISERV